MSDPALTAYINQREFLIAVACRVVESRAVAEEIVQESWLRWHGRDYEPNKAHLVFRRIVTNLALDWRRRRTSEYSALSEIATFSDHAPSSETAVVARAELASIVRTLRALPKRNVRAFKMRTLEGATYKEIAGTLGLSISQTYALIEHVMVEIGLALDG